MTEDSAFFEIVPPRPVAPAARPLAVASGPAWRVERQPDGLWLFYLSGEQGGGERAILVDQADVDALRAGDRSLDDVLIARGAS